MKDVKPQFNSDERQRASRNPHHTRDAEYWDGQRFVEAKARHREKWQRNVFVIALCLAAWDVAFVPGDVGVLTLVWASLFTWVYTR